MRFVALLFDEPNARAWLAVFEKMEGRSHCDLLPSETENAFIAAMRLSIVRDESALR